MKRRKPTAHELKQLRRDNALQPVTLTEIPRTEWPLAVALDHARMPLQVWRSREFLVMAYKDGGALRLSVMRTDRDRGAKRFRDGISWDELQRVKREAGFGDYCAVELFPPDAQVVDVANMRHLWILDEPPAFMWTRPTFAERAVAGCAL